MVEFYILQNIFLSFTTKNKNKATFIRLTSLNNFKLNIYKKNNKSFQNIFIMGIGDWGLGIGER